MLNNLIIITVMVLSILNVVLITYLTNKTKDDTTNKTKK
jgi:hypothetical protein